MRYQNNNIFSGVVQDVNDNLVDFGAGNFWRTTKRLKLTPFSDPLGTTRIVLVASRPEETYSSSLGKVFAPFSTQVWCLIIGLIAFTALLSVWFSREMYGRGVNQKKNQNRMKKRVYCRLFVDNILEKGTYFSSAGVEQDKTSSLPEKVSMLSDAY